MKDFSPRTVGNLFDYSPDGPGEVYRLTYKYTDCGPTVGFRLAEPSLAIGHRYSEPTYYCNDLHKLGTWGDMAKRGERVVSLLVSSIVEGIDACTETIEVPIHPHGTFLTRWNQAIEDVDKEADRLWKETHGCEDCQKHWQAEGYGDGTLDGMIPVWDECPGCGGGGQVL